MEQGRDRLAQGAFMAQHRKQEMADLPEGGDSPLNVAVMRRDRSTLDMVADAIRHRQTMLAFQPVVQAQAQDRPAYYEGLIRVLDATGRVIPAREFMSQVEDSATGRLLVCAALEKCLHTLARNTALRISVNMSARSIGYKRWLSVLESHLKRDKTLGERLILEINEASTMTVPELVVDFMDQMQRHGIAFALDDFGSGRITTRYFRDFFFDAVKIDGQYIRGIDQNPDNQVLTRALVAFARQFEMLTIAESVETAGEAEFLRAIGVDCLQGYLFGAPTVRPHWQARNKSASA